VPQQQSIPQLRTPPVNVEDLPKLDLDALANAPAQPGVYLAIDNAGRVWYVGIANSLRQRLTTHDRLEDFKAHGVSCIAWLNESRPDNRLQIERDLIEFCHPPLNNQNNFNSLPTFDYGLSQEQEIERFFRLRIQQKLIELEIERLKPNLVTYCEQAPNRKIIHPLGTIQAQSYKSWKFSPELEERKRQLLEAQKAEKESGVAKVKSISISPVARIAAGVLSGEVAIWISQLEEEIEDSDLIKKQPNSQLSIQDVAERTA
jgi:hypothetical protein